MRTLRFVLSDNVLNSIIEFSKLHRQEHRLVYKKEWNNWLEINKEMVQDEVNRMKTIGYNDCVLTKMFDAGRYYFRKKELAKENKEKKQKEKKQREKDENDDEDEHEDEEEDKKKEKKYVTLDKTILYDIECHIKNNISNDDYTPSNGYFDFHVKNVRVLNKEKTRLEMEVDDFINKIKKTYKNKYFFIKRQISKIDNEQREEQREEQV
jgi:hypothetical protein